jgi:ribonuclease R
MTPADRRPPAAADDLGAALLELLAGHGKPMGVRDIVRRLGLDGPRRRELKDVLRRLLGTGELVKIHGARVGLPSRMNLVVGRLTANPAGFGFVVPERPAGAPRSREDDVYVSAVNMKEALHGDRVVARVERHTPKGAEGRIIRVLERAQQRIVGRFETDGRFGGNVIPFDKRVLHELFVPRGTRRGRTPGTWSSSR